MNNSKVSKTITLTGTQKPFLARNETLNMYYNEIRKYSVLSQEETIKLFNLLHNGTEKEREYARNELFNHNAKLVTSLARQYCTANDNLMDLIEEGNIGLLNAINKFRTDKESSFQKFALFHIRREINLFKINYSPIVQQTNRSKTDSNVSNIISRLIQKEKRTPTEEEVLDEYNRQNPTKKIIEKTDMVSVEYVFIDSLEATNGEFTDSQSFLDYSNKTCSYNDYMHKAENENHKAMLESLMVGLTPKEKKAISLFYGLDGRIEASLNMIGTLMDCTSERARQLCKAAVEKMHKKAEQLAYSL